MLKTEMAKKEIRIHFINEMEQKIKFLHNNAIWSLYYGDEAIPTSDDWPGYIPAIKILEEWAEENLSEVWFDIQVDQLYFDEPEPFEDEDGNMVEPFWDDYIYFSKSEVKRIVFGELVGNGM